MRQAFIALCLMLSACGIARAVTWTRSARGDPFTGTRNISVIGEGAHGGGVIVRCYERKLSVDLVMKDAYGNADQISQMASSDLLVPYRIRIDRQNVMKSRVPASAVRSRDGYIVLPVERSRSKAFAKTLLRGHQLAYQFAPPDGRVYQLSLAGARNALGYVVDACLSQQRAVGASSSEKPQGESAGANAGGTGAAVHECGSARGPHPTKRQKERYADALSKAVEQNWIRPPGVSGTVKCRVSVTQDRFGDVLSVHALGSCGSESVNLSVTNAVKRASPLPLPHDCALFREKVVMRFSAPGG